MNPKQDKTKAIQLGADCANCPLKDRPIQYPETPTESAKLIVLGEGPGLQEIKKQQGFIGPSGDLLWSTGGKKGMTREQCHVANATLCLPPKQGMNPKEWEQALICCRHRLYRELKGVGSKFVLALGAKALRTMCKLNNITWWMGAPLTGTYFRKWTKRCRKERPLGELCSFHKYKVLPAFHPAFVLRPTGKNWKKTCQIHIQRAWLMATGQLGEFVWPPNIVWPGPDMVAALKHILKSGKPVGVDTEGNKVITRMGLATTDYMVSIPWESYYTKQKFVPETETYVRDSFSVSGLTEDDVEIQTQEFVDTRKVPGVFEGDWAGLGQEIIDLTSKILASDCDKVFQYGIHDIPMIERNMGIKVGGKCHDTMVMSALVWPERKVNDLGSICCVEFHADRWKSLNKDVTDKQKHKGEEFCEVRPPHGLGIYNGKDSGGTVISFLSLAKRLEKIHRGQEQYETKLRLMGIAQRMGDYGVCVNVSKALELRQRMCEERDACVLELAKIAGKEDFKPSGKQLHWFLGKRLGLKSPKKGKELDSWDRGVLEKFILEHPDELVKNSCQLILDYRMWEKRQGTNLKGFLDSLDENGVYHTSFKPWLVSDRWSEKYIQVIPKPKKERTELGKQIRQIIAARDGKCLMISDYDQLEMRNAGLLSGDRMLLDAFAAGEDPHFVTAMLICNQNERVAKDFRDPAKTVNFQMLYGGSEEAMYAKLWVLYPDVMERLGMTLIRFKKIYALIRSKRPQLEQWQRKLKDTARRFGFVENPMSGRRREFEKSKKGNFMFEPGKVLNFPCQSLAAWLIDCAVQDIDSQVDYENHGLVIQAHDELVMETGDPIWSWDCFQQNMRREVTYQGNKVSYEIGVDLGFNWGVKDTVKNLDDVRHWVKENRRRLKSG